MPQKRGLQGPLIYAIGMIDAAMDIAYFYLHDTKRVPSDEELAQMDRLAESLSAYHATARYILRKMRERAGGRLEADHGENG